MISNCGKDERGGYSGGQAGDQTGGEYKLINWYNRPWDCVLRHPDARVRGEIAKLARAAAQNDAVGYDQYERLTFWEQLQKCGYDPAAIQIPCEADCSSSTAAIVKAVGYRLGNSRLMSVNTSLTTYNMKNALQSVGFDVLTENRYVKSDACLLAGDILLNESAHAAICVSNGASADVNYGGSPTTPVSTTPVDTTPVNTGNVTKGSLVSIQQNASWWSGRAVPDWVVRKRWYVVSVNGLRAVLGKSDDGKYNINSPISANFLTVVTEGETKAGYTPQPTQPVQTKPGTYLVKPGDTLWSIAASVLGDGTRWREIQKVNGLSSDRIYVGQTLKLP